MANTKLPSTGTDPRIHNHVVNYYRKRIKSRSEVLSHRLHRRVRSAIRSEISLDKDRIKQFRKKGFTSL